NAKTVNRLHIKLTVYSSKKVWTSCVKYRSTHLKHHPISIILGPLHIHDLPQSAPHGVIEVLLKRLLSLLYCSASRSPSFTLFSHWSACMATAASPRQMMYTQIVSQPALLLEVFDTTERAVQDAFTRFQPQRWQAIYTAGCGDSYYAG